MGLVFVFDIVNVKDGPTRYKHALYYTLVLVEDGILLAFWYIESGGNHVSQVNSIFYLCIHFDVLYYKILYNMFYFFTKGR